MHLVSSTLEIKYVSITNASLMYSLLGRSFVNRDDRTITFSVSDLLVLQMFAISLVDLKAWGSLIVNSQGKWIYAESLTSHNISNHYPNIIQTNHKYFANITKLNQFLLKSMLTTPQYWIGTEIKSISIIKHIHTGNDQVQIFLLQTRIYTPASKACCLQWK